MFFRKRVVGRTLFIAVFSAILAHNGFAEDSSSDCSRSLLDDESLNKLSVEESLLGKSIPLIDFINGDFVSKHPSIVMNAHQRILAMILSQGVKEYGQRKVYPLLSEGLTITKGRRVSGHETELENFVEQVRHGTEGDPNVKNFIGPHGTGKSELLDTLSEGLRYLTANDPNHYFYSFEWFNLYEIPILREELEITEEMKGEHKLPSFMNDSPIVLLPTAYQQKLVELGSPAVRKLIGMDARPRKLKGNDWDEYFKEQIFLYYEKQLGRSLTAKERVGYLNKHVRIRQVVLGENGSAPKLDAQERSVDIRSLLVTPNIKIILKYGADHPLAYFPNGTILRANGSIIFFDELYRNDKKLLNLYLGLFQSGRAAVSGGRPVYIDFLPIAASNYESLQELEEEGSVGAFVDRMDHEPFKWALNPYVIMDTLVLMQKKSGKMEMRKLGTEASNWEPIDLAKLFPRDSKTGEIHSGPDGRYELRMNSAGRMVYISPHALMFFSGFLSMTRSIYEIPKAIKYGERSILNTGYFRSPTVRLRYHLGETQIGSSEEEELKEVIALMGEGSEKGMSTRDFDRWFKACLSRAVREARSGDAVLTPELAKQVLIDRLDHGKIKVDSKTYLYWKGNFAETMAKGIILPRLASDVTRALGRIGGQSDAAYDQIIAEILTRAKDPGAQHYEDPLNQSTSRIDFERLEEIKKEYFNVSNGNVLDEAQIALTHALINQNRPGARHPDLLAAINSYYARLIRKSTPLAQLVSYGQSGTGDGKLATTYQAVISTLKNELGYHEKAALAALNFMLQYESTKKQVGSD